MGFDTFFIGVDNRSQLGHFYVYGGFIMLSNYPPGVTDSDIPGSRPEDKEVELSVILTMGDLQTLQEWIERKPGTVYCQEVNDVLFNLWDQVKEEYEKLIPPRY
jgi:hypothetical protein